MAPEEQPVFDKKLFTQWLRKRPEMKSISYQLYIACILLLSRNFSSKSFGDTTADYAIGAVVIYLVFLFVQLYRKKTSLKRVYQAEVASASRSGETNGALPHATTNDAKRLPSRTTTAGKYVVAVLVAGVLASFLLPRHGEGLDATLDANNGFDVNYHASLAKAFEKMSDDQKSTYNWVMQDFAEGHYISRYGKEPTVREVIKGQLDLWDKNNDKAIVEQEAVVASKSEEIAARAAVQERAKKMLGTIYATAEISTRSGRKSCEGLVCDDGEVTLVSYKVTNPNNLNLAKMPCSVKITPRGSETYYTYDLDGCAKQGAFETRIIVPKGVSFDGAALTVLFTDDEATLGYGSPAGYGEPAIPGDIPEVVKLKQLQRNKKNIADGRASLKA